MATGSCLSVGHVGDGLWVPADEAEIQSVVTSSGDVQRTRQKVVLAANAAGGGDTLTAVPV